MLPRPRGGNCWQPLRRQRRQARLSRLLQRCALVCRQCWWSCCRKGRLSNPLHELWRRHALPPQAVIKGYEPMPGLQGKDYGKQRMT